MKIYVDVRERENLGNVLLGKDYILSVAKSLEKDFYNTDEHTIWERKKMRDGYDVIQKLITLYQTQENLARDPNKKETLKEIEKDLKKERKHIRDKILPHLKDLYGAVETDLYNRISQGDVLIVKKNKTMWELKNTSVDLKIAIEDPDKRSDIYESLDRCKNRVVNGKKAPIGYRLAVALPNENEKEVEWRINNEIDQKDYSEFFGMDNPKPRKIRMPNEVYKIDKTFFYDLEDSIEKLKKKQKIIMDYLISKSV